MRVMMDTVAASAPGKVILFGEHSVVYGKPAVAASLSDLRIRADCSVFSKEENYDESSSNNATVTTKSPPILLMELPDLNLTCSVPLPCLLETRHALHAPPTAACVLELEQLVRRLSHRHWPDGRKRRFGSTTAEANNDSDTNTDDSAAMVHALLPVLYLVAQLTPLHMLKQDNISLRVQVASTGLPCGAGLGSSAAFGVALAAALYQWQQRQSRTESSSENVVTHDTVPSATDINTINTHAYHSEILLHGRPSGIDNTVSSHGGALLFTRNYHHEVHLDPVPLARPLRLLLVHTHVPRHTKSLVAQVRALHDKYPRVVQPILDAMGQIAVTFCEMQQQSAVTTTTMSKMGNANVTNETLLTLVRTNQRLLSALGVSHDCLDRICAAVLRTCPKAAAAKLTGAGGGGCAMIVLCGGTDNHSKNNDKEEAQLMAEIQRAAGTEYTYTFLSSTVGGDGVLFVAPEPWSSISMTREDRSAWGVLTSRLLGMTTTETTTTTVTSRWWTVAMGAAAVSAGLLLVRTHKGR